MFLKLLKPEEKTLFLEFAYSLAKKDGNFADAEEAMMDAYGAEMGVTFDLTHAPKDTCALVQQMAETMEPAEKKIAFFELVGLALADGEYGADERKTMQELAQAFGMTEAYAQDCEKLLKEYFGLQKRMTAAVLG